MDAINDLDLEELRNSLEALDIGLMVDLALDERLARQLRAMIASRSVRLRSASAGCAERSGAPSWRLSPAWWARRHKGVFARLRRAVAPLPTLRR
jgi:hypothetical protein